MTKFYVSSNAIFHKWFTCIVSSQEISTTPWKKTQNESAHNRSGPKSVIKPNKLKIIFLQTIICKFCSM